MATKQHRYTREQFEAAYQRWRATQRYVVDLLGLPFMERQACLAVRNKAWDEYCDARDWAKPGTNRSRRVRLEQLQESDTNVVPIKKS